MEAEPNLENSIEGSFEVSGEQRQALLNYLRESEIGKQISEETEVLSEEESQLAERLLSLGLKADVMSPSNIHSHDEYPYRPDMDKRKEAFFSAGLDTDMDKLEIARHEIVLDKIKEKIPAIKVINLVKKERKDLENGSFDLVGKPLKGGAILLAKISYAGRYDGNPQFIPLSEEERRLVEEALGDID